MGAEILRLTKERVILNVNGREKALLMVDESQILLEMGSYVREAWEVKPPEQRLATQGAMPP